MIKKCLICGNEFETIKYGASRKYCFDCSPHFTKGNMKEQGDTITCIRHAVKKELIKRKGGRCERCGYDKCQAALEFHHLDSLEKDFNLANFVSKQGVNLEKVFSEVEKCVLLCSNCHHEFHFLNKTYEEFLKD